MQQATPPAGYVRQPWVNSAGIAQDDAEYPTTHSATDTPITLKQAAFQNATQAGYTAKRRYIMLQISCDLRRAACDRQHSNPRR